jgi:hypothetical protein
MKFGTETFHRATLVLMTFSQVTAIFGLSQTIRSISNRIDTNCDKIPNFLAWLNDSFFTGNICSMIGQIGPHF